MLNVISWEGLGVTSQICVLKNPCVWERSVKQKRRRYQLALPLVTLLVPG